MKSSKKYDISKLTCVFKNKDFENEYFESIMKRDEKYLKILIIVIGVAYSLFLIPEWIFLDMKGAFNNLVLIRIFTIIIIACLYFMIKGSESSKKICLLISLLEIILIGSYFFTIAQYTTIEYFMKVIDMIVMISVVFIIPNKFIYKFIVSMVCNIGFFIMAVIIFKDVETYQFVAGTVYSFIMTSIMTTVYYRRNYFGRINYMYGRKFKSISEKDHLTGIYNRVRLDEEIIRWIKHKERYSSSVSIIFMDFDEFKYVNDKHGHSKGDEILKKGAEIVNELVRETDIFARWGGEEFIILLPETGKTEALILAERIRCSIENYEFIQNEKVTCSFGVVEIEENENVYQVFDRVDGLLYTAKEYGRNQVMGRDTA